MKFESEEVKEFRNGVLSGNWDLVYSIIPGFQIAQLKEHRLKLCIKEQKYYEQISQGDYRDALDTLRGEVTPLHQDSKSLHHLASLLLCKSSEELKQTSEWETNRDKVLNKVQELIPANVMIPAKRLSVLISQALGYQVHNCAKHCGFFQTESLLEDHSCDNFTLPTVAKLTIEETDEVWELIASHNGDLLGLICAKSHFSVWNVKGKEKIVCFTEEVSGAGFTLNDLLIATGSSAGLVKVWNLQGQVLYNLKEHTEKVTSCIWISENTLLTGGVDQKLIMWDNKLKAKQWDIRVRQIEKSQDACFIAVLNASKNEVIVMGYSPLDKVCVLIEDEDITSICINKSGTQILVAVSLTQPVFFI